MREEGGIGPMSVSWSGCKPMYEWRRSKRNLDPASNAEFCSKGIHSA
jgi:hypothetical protein